MNCELIYSQDKVDDKQCVNKDFEKNIFKNAEDGRGKVVNSIRDIGDIQQFNLL